jgi:hypothetical protein
MRSKAHTALTAPLVLHPTWLDKCVMKKFGINGQLSNKIFFFNEDLSDEPNFSRIHLAGQYLQIKKFITGKGIEAAGVYFVNSEQRERQDRF